MKRNECATALMAMSILAISAGTWAADLDTVKVVFDPAFTDRTNMGRPAGETGELRVSFDPDFLARTNVHRHPDEVHPVRVSRDDAFMQRTNMGGSSLTNRPLAAPPLTTATAK